MRSRFLAIVSGLSVTLLCSSSVTRGSEFGNIFGRDDIEIASSQASALALQALQTTLEGLRQRELREGDGTDKLREASALLRSAAEQMQKIIEEGLGELGSVNITGETYSDYAKTIEVSSHAFSFDKPSNIYELYISFTRSTSIMADIIEKNAFANDGPVFTRISQPLQQYFALAEAVTEVSRRAVRPQ